MTLVFLVGDKQDDTRGAGRSTQSATICARPAGRRKTKQLVINCSKLTRAAALAPSPTLRTIHPPPRED
jgi:hypothetical protein